MVTKAYIKRLPAIDDNHFMVRIPYMEDNTGQEVIVPALLCNQPGSYGGYQLGDCVFVTFESDKHMDDEAIGDVPVIIGKLYIEDSSPTPSSLKIESLSVVKKVNLPTDSKIGKYSVKDIFSAAQSAEAALSRIENIEEAINNKDDPFINDLLKQISGYNASVSQTLKHDTNGSIQWVND